MAVEGTAKFNTGSILRIILGVIIVFLVAFLLVRFISSRENKAEEVTLQPAQTQNKDDGSIAGSSDDAKEDTSEKESSDSAKSDEVPTGIADSDQGLPAVGMGGSAVSSVFVVAMAAYLGVYIVQRKRVAQG